VEIGQKRVASLIAFLAPRSGSEAVLIYQLTVMCVTLNGLPHQGELVQAFSKENPSKDEVPNFKHVGADVAAVVAAKALVLGCTCCCMVRSLLEEKHVILVELILAGLIES
jgi:hypothetical protein